MRSSADVAGSKKRALPRFARSSGAPDGVWIGEKWRRACTRADRDELSLSIAVFDRGAAAHPVPAMIGVAAMDIAAIEAPTYVMQSVAHSRSLDALPGAGRAPAEDSLVRSRSNPSGSLSMAHVPA